jgi:hypothetical protein
MTYTMIVKTSTVASNGRTSSATERVPHLMEDELDARREAARQSAPRGATRTIRVVPQR